jgi:small subunit ribosomal protein S8
MSSHDPLADFLTAIRNASNARKDSCAFQWSKMRAAVANILLSEGYLAAVDERTDERGHKVLALTLKYVDGVPAITGIRRESSPGRRRYCGSREIPRVLGGLGVAILTTSGGVLKDADARQRKLGGEILCKVW